jgi:prophage regulatory protein
MTKAALRLKDIIGDRKATPPRPALLPVSRSHWYEGIRQGVYPKPSHQFGSRIAVWAVEDIIKLLEREVAP